MSSAGLERLKTELTRWKPKLVLICHGGNDILRRLPGSATEQNLRKMVALTRESGAEVLLIAVPNVSLFPKAPSYYASIETDLNVPIEYGVLSDLQSDNSKKSDAVYFNSTGYRKFAEAVLELLVSEGAI